MLHLPLFLTHHNLQGSQTVILCTNRNIMFLTHHNLQGSQTDYPTIRKEFRFLTHHNLQGSQTDIDYVYDKSEVSYPS